MIALPALVLAAGLTLGLGGYLVHHSKADSYLTDDPAACANCHVMQGHYDAWLKSSHHAVAVCNDCHTPSHPIAKYLVKAENGLHHSIAFTTGDYPDQIRAREASRQVVEAQCRHCHAALVAAMTGGGEGERCVRCHAGVGHAE